MTSVVGRSNQLKAHRFNGFKCFFFKWIWIFITLDLEKAKTNGLIHQTVHYKGG